MVEGARLESVFRGNSNVGSNPTLSAMKSRLNACLHPHRTPGFPTRPANSSSALASVDPSYPALLIRLRIFLRLACNFMSLEQNESDSDSARESPLLTAFCLL